MTEQLKPEAVFRWFGEINKVPRPSNKEEKMQEFLVGVGNRLGLDTRRDETGNVIIRKPATPGMENRATVIVQSHMDMVCEKVAGLNFNFLTDPIETYVEDGWMRARGTTLGADDGIGVAMELALLEAEDIEHGPIECVFTVAEETSLGGASGMKAGFMTGKYLLNLDSEDEGQIFISCAGGGNLQAFFDVEKAEAREGDWFLKVSVAGLVGGHSGDDIEKKRANANKLLFRVLHKLLDYDLRLVDIQSGGLHNAIPRDGYAICAVPATERDRVAADFNMLTAAFREEYAVTERSMEFALETVETQAETLTEDLTQRLVKAVIAAANGVFDMSQDIEGFVETSSNLASVRLQGDVIRLSAMQRSNLTSKRLYATAALRCVFELAGARVETNAGYPGWHLNPESPLLKITVDAYTRLFGHEPLVRAIHAGLECGLFSEKYPEIDMVSFGPTLRGVHSPDERLEVATVQMVWDHLLEVLKNIPEA